MLELFSETELLFSLQAAAKIMMKKKKVIGFSHLKVTGSLLALSNCLELNSMH